MRVLFDAYWWVEGPPSNRRVVDSFIRTWAAAWPADELTAAVPRGHLAEARRLAEGIDVSLRPVRLRPHGVSVLTELSRAADADVVLAQNFTPLRSRALRATFIHDVMFEEHPEFFTRAERLYFAGMPWSARFADLVLTSSHAEAARIARCVPRVADRVVPIGLGVQESFRARTPVDPDLGVVPGRFLLCVGRLNVRKNLDRLVGAVIDAGVVTPDFPLVVVGEPDGRAMRRTLPDDGRVRFVGGIDDARLKWLYESCRLFVFPSLDEGFGLPVVEASVAGAPMALSDIPAFRELAPTAVFFDPHDEAGIAAAISAELAGAPSASPVMDVPSWTDVVGRMRAAIQERLAGSR